MLALKQELRRAMRGLPYFVKPGAPRRGTGEGRGGQGGVDPDPPACPCEEEGMGLNGSLSRFPLSPPPCCSPAFPALSPPTRLGPPSLPILFLPFYSSHFIPHLVPSAISVRVPQVSPGVGVP